MPDARSTSRYAAFLLGGSVLVAGALVASGIHAARSSAPAEATEAPITATGDQGEFQTWAGDGEEADGKLIGEIQHNGKTIELRQLPEGARPDQASHDFVPDEDMTGQSESSR